MIRVLLVFMHYFIYKIHHVVHFYRCIIFHPVTLLQCISSCSCRWAFGLAVFLISKTEESNLKYVFKDVPQEFPQTMCLGVGFVVLRIQHIECKTIV